MSKVTQAQAELEDTGSLMELIEILKNIASNHFYKMSKEHSEKTEFLKVFRDFFNIACSAGGGSFLSKSRPDKVEILAFTSEGGFSADLTAKVIRMAIEEAERHDVHEFIVIGKKGAVKLNPMTDRQVTLFKDVEITGFYNMAVQIKDYIFDKLKNNKIGGVYAVYPKARTISLVKQSAEKIFPPEDLLSRKKEIDKEQILEQVIFESDADKIIAKLSGIWLSFRILQILEDLSLAGYAAQAQQLDAALETLKEMKKVKIRKYRKARKSEIDKALREVFTAVLMAPEEK